LAALPAAAAIRTTGTIPPVAAAAIAALFKKFRRETPGAFLFWVMGFPFLVYRTGKSLDFMGNG
jgi:hypothetical protein